MGYVGLPLALQAEAKGYSVIGVDLSRSKLEKLRAKQSPIDDPLVSKRIKNTKINFTDDFSKLSTVSIAIICVPTPVNHDKMPNLSIVKNAAVSAADNLKPGSLLIIESTINPGVCDEALIPAIEAKTDHKVGKTLHIAHCPERINPGDPKWHIGNISRVLGADSKESLEMAYQFYSKLIDAKIKKMGSLMEAEAVKIVENSFRDINIAFVNELAKSFHLMGINLENVIDGAATKPFAFMPHRPGCGVGGHCIPVDPYYLIEHAKDRGFDHKFLRLARDINESMPDFTVSMFEEALDSLSSNKEVLRVVIFGQAYKPDVNDHRESPGIKVFQRLIALGYEAKRYDPYLPEKSDFLTLEDALKFGNSVIICTAHSEFSSIPPSMFEEYSVQVIVDGRNLYKNNLNAFKDHGILYRGVGI